MGMTSLALSRTFGLPESTLVRIAEHFVNDRQVINRGGYFATLDHRPVLGSEQRAFFDVLVPVDKTRPLLPVPFGGITAATRRSQIAGLSRAFDTMLARPWVHAAATSEPERHRRHPAGEVVPERPVPDPDAARKT